MEGLVLRIDAKLCHVEVDGKTLTLPLRGRLFETPSHQVRPVAVGDRVKITLDAQGGAIDEVLPRTSQLIRASIGNELKEQVIAANVTLVMVVAAIREPSFRPELVDRILAGAEREEIDAVVALTKMDLDRNQEAEHWAALYRGVGYRVLQTSVNEPAEPGLDELGELLRQNVTVLTGASGVGKSSLINTLVPGLDLKIGNLGRIRQGKHTTAHTRLLPLPGGGHVLDTPGIRNFGLQHLLPIDLSFCFREIKPYVNQCGYRDCVHTVEPNCAVLAALEADKIQPSRYESYKLMLQDLSRG
ncbi:MAG: ribosome small subunit-dependent GTPase A [Planctomycetota bacterium]